MANINLTTVPFSTIIRRPGGGAEGWHNESQAVYEKAPMDSYYRFVWTRLEGATQGSYNWAFFDGLVNQAISRKQKLSFGIMTDYPDGDAGLGLARYADGSHGSYPEYLHKAMQAESVKDWKANVGTWVPNYNSPTYHARLLALHKSLNQHIIDKGWQKVIQFIDIRGYGCWGEWNSSGIVGHVNEYPAGTFPTVASLKKIVDAHRDGFPDFPLVAMIAGFDAQWLGNVWNPAEIAYYLLTQKNNWGLFGWRRDQWGAHDGYLKDYLEFNTRSFNGVVFNTLIMDRWKFAPITGEPMPSGDNMNDLLRQVMLYHATSFGDGNYGGFSNLAEITENVKQASNACGYKLQIESGNFTLNGNAISTTLNWKNGGIGPTYEDWQAVLFLKKSDGTTAAQSVSLFKPKLFLPAAVASAITDSFVFSIPAGTYTLSVKVIDPKGYRDPMPLFNAGRQADGSYNLGTVVTGTTPPPVNVGPVVSAGSDITITLPVNMVTLVGSASDSDGTIAKVLWAKVSGSGTPATPNVNSTIISGLLEGISVYKFTGTDNAGAIASDQVTITVKPAVVVPPPTPDRKLIDITTAVKTTTTLTAIYDDGSKEVIVK